MTYEGLNALVMSGASCGASAFSVCLCVRPGLLLLCMVASEVWDAETKPIEFVCNKGARRAMNIVAEMESALVRI